MTKISSQKDFSRIMGLDYLKAIAATLVIFAHTLNRSQRIKIAGPFWISMAVPIFMIISGFTNTLSADHSDYKSLKDFYQKNELWLEFSKILSPYVIIIVFEYFLGFYQLFVRASGPFIDFSLKDYLYYFLIGGTTPGSYYIPILIQFVFLFPIMFIFYKKSPIKSIVFFISMHLLFDIVANYLPLPTKVYRLLIFRYLAFIILGIALYYSYDRLKRSTKWFTLLSISYISAYTLGYRMTIFSKWPNTALPTAFWALTLVILGIEYLEQEPNRLISSFFHQLGKASYHIFLVQKLLFGFGLNTYFKSFTNNIFIRLILILVICYALGLLFYKIETENRIGGIQ